MVRHAPKFCHRLVLGAWYRRPAQLGGVPVLLDEAACREAFAAIGRPPLLRAEFTQEKTLPDVARPLRANGELLVSAEHGVILRTLSPEFARTTKVMPLAPGATDKPGVEARISRMIRAVLAGEYGPLAEFFSAQGRRDGAHLHLTLTPKSADVRSALRSIELRFGTYLEVVDINEAAGSRVRLTFSGFRPSPGLSADERRSFAEASAR